ncbi:MAG: hypothetical protein NVS2B14_02390 [Chamaesiphon sp.]
MVLIPELKSKFKKATTPQERILFYAENALWYETLTNLAEERRKNPHAFQLDRYWEDLLKSPLVQLDELVTEKNILCCTR